MKRGAFTQMENNRHQKLGLSDQDVLEMYELMVLARRLDERMWLLNRAGKIPFVISGQGHEGAQIGAAFALNRKKDYLLPYYRDLALVLAFGMSPREVMLGAFAKAEDPSSGGRQMSSHFGQKKNRIVTGSSPVTTQVPHAVGFALAAKMKKQNFVSFTTFGEGSSNQGDFHEGLNFAGIHNLPVIFMCQNNQYAISVPIEKQLPTKSIADRAAGYGMPGYKVDGSDPLEVYRVVKEARERAIKGDGPTLIEALTNRFTPHSSDDDDKAYRNPEEVKNARQNDPIVIFGKYLIEVGLLDEPKRKEIEERMKGIVNDATDYAEQAPYAKPEDALKYVYKE
jgi:2-oxoisovalerate dehydrogenase E1 component alpha subunit